MFYRLTSDSLSESKRHTTAFLMSLIKLLTMCKTHIKNSFSAFDQRGHELIHSGRKMSVIMSYWLLFLWRIWECSGFSVSICSTSVD